MMENKALSIFDNLVRNSGLSPRPIITDKKFSRRLFVEATQSRLWPNRSLPKSLKQADASGDGDVEALHRADHGDGGEEVAALFGEAAQALPLGTHDDAQRPAQVEFVQGLLGVTVQPHQPDAALLQLFQAARQIGDLHEGHGLRGAAGHLDGGGGQ